MSPRPVDVGAIERELAQLWVEPHPDSEKPTQVTRAVMSNLIVFCTTHEEAAAIPPEVAAIVPQHPCRVLMLIGNPSHPR